MANLDLGAVIGVTIGTTIGAVLLVIGCLLFMRCFLRWRKQRSVRHIDLEAPFDVKGLSSIKDTELVTSPNIVVSTLDDAEKLAMNGLTVVETESPTKAAQQYAKQGSAKGSLQHSGSGNAIMQWLESAELSTHDVEGNNRELQHVLSGNSDVSSSKTPARSMLSSRLSNFSIKNITGRLDSAELNDMRKRLLLATNLGYAGDSAASPIDVKGVVFSRLPPSRKASPAPSTIEGSTISRAKTRRFDAGHSQQNNENLAPEEQLVSPPVRRSSSLSRTFNGGAPLVPTSSTGGVAFARIDSLPRNGSLSRTLPRRLEVSQGGLSTDNGHVSPSNLASGLPPLPSKSFGQAGGTFPRTAPQKHMTYAEAMAALEHATSPVALQKQHQLSDGGALSPPSPAPTLPVSVPAGMLDESPIKVDMV